jgi:osomolarity two-component system response regulator SSK1
LTGYLTSWGLEPHHVAIDRDRTNDSVTESWQSQKAADSKDRSFGTESSNSHSDAPVPVSPPQPELLLPSSSSSSKATPAEALDPSISFLFIDDDISTLRKQLILVKNAAPSVHLQNAFLSKRPGLASRRTRSSAQIRPAMPAVALSIIYFTSLSKFRYIRELVQSIFRSVSHMFPLPEVLVLPKPVGPRRLLTALHTAVRRPLLDPTVVPIATSPSSPGGHYFFASSARPSPAPSNQQDFELAFAEAGRVGEIRETSPTLGAPSGTSARPAVSNGSSPHASAEAVEYMEYMSKSAADMGNSASSGIVIQSPDGKTSGLFFHPIKKAGPPGSSSLRESTGPTSRMVRERMPTAEMDSAEEPDEPVLREVGQPSPLLIPSPVDQEQPAPPLMTSPIQLMPIRSIGGGSQAGREPAPGSSPTDTGSRALSLDEFANTPPVSSAERPDLGLSHPSTPPPSFRRMATAPAIHQTLSDSTHNVSRSPPLHSPGPVTPRSPVTPGSSQLREGSLASPQLPATPPQPANTIGVRSPRSGSKRRESTPKENRRNSRAASGTKGKGSSVMPPINVLIVEGDDDLFVATSPLIDLAR